MSEVLGSWIDGVEGSSLPVDDRGLQYGDGLFETMLVRAGRVRFIDDHLARLDLGRGRLGIPLLPGDLRAEMGAALARAPQLAILKLIVTRGSVERRGYAPRGVVTPRRVLTLFAAPPLPATWRSGVDLRVASLRLSTQPLLAGIKHLNRLENVLAAAEPGHDAVFDSVLLDTQGNVIAGTTTNVFIVAGGRVATARPDRCGVAGVMRGIVLRECAKLGIPCDQGEVSLAQLHAADEAFITNARIGVVPVRRVGEHSFPMNEIALRLADHIEALDA
jgi:4-amino-4-deoxychorismate lyase